MVEVPDLQEEPKKLTVEEFELSKFKERERQDRIKKELKRYRRSDTIFNTPKEMDIFREGATIFNSDKRKRKPKKPQGLLGMRGNLFGR